MTKQEKVLAALEKEASALADLEKRLTTRRRRRDQLIRRALAAGCAVTHVATAAGITRARIYQQGER